MRSINGQAEALLTMNSHLECNVGDKISYMTSGQNEPLASDTRRLRPTEGLLEQIRRRATGYPCAGVSGAGETHCCLPAGGGKPAAAKDSGDSFNSY